MEPLPPSLLRVLHRRGYKTEDHINRFLAPPLHLAPFSITDLSKAVERLRQAIRREEPIALYADRDVDGLSGLAILVRSLRTLGANVVWGSPLEGRGLERSVLETLVKSGAKVMILVDCGTGETGELTWLAAQGIDVIVADHHRMLADRPPALAWIHPEPASSASPPAPLLHRRGGSPSPVRRWRRKPGHAETPCGSRDGV